MIFENVGSGAGFIFEKRPGIYRTEYPVDPYIFYRFGVIVIEGQTDG